MQRERAEEILRDFRPPRPPVPVGWSLEHKQGSNRFDLRKQCDIQGSGPEALHVIAFLEVKQPESTYRMDTGEREEEEHITFSCFLDKARWSRPSGATGVGGGGLEFTLTSIDHELVLDNLCIHSTTAAFEAARTMDERTMQCVRNARYRGPMINELDEELLDEILDYLDERGVNNGFAEYMMAQAHFFEQEEYENWLRLLQEFAK